MNGRTCGCIVPVRGPGHGCVFSARCCAAAYSLPGRGVRSELILELVCYIFRVCTCGTVFDLDSLSSVSCMCMCACTLGGMCSPSVVLLVLSTCMRALYSIWHGQPGRRA